MATWAGCPDLFLYTKRKDVYLWRCNETTWMPMKTADFDDLGKVTDHQDLVGGRDAVFDWEESSYNDLVAYISSRRLLVNCRGLVIAELQEFDQDGKMEENGLPFYMRSLDVLSLKTFGLKNRTIPSRMVLYLETEGKTAPVEDSTTTTTTTTTSTNMEKQVAELKAANKTLKSDKETAERNAEKAEQERDAAKSDKEAAKSDKETAERKAEKAQQERDAAKSDKETAERNAEKAQQERDAAEQERDAAKSDKEALKSGKEAAERKAEKAQQERDAAKRDKEAAERKAADLQTQIDSLAINEKKEVWMTEFSDQAGNWKTFDGLNKEIYRLKVNMIFPRGYQMKDDDLSTNVRSSYIYRTDLVDVNNNKTVYCKGGSRGEESVFHYHAVRLIDLNPNKERAKFNFLQWYRGTCNGDMYAFKAPPDYHRHLPPGDSTKLSAEEVKSLNLLDRGPLGC